MIKYLFSAVSLLAFHVPATAQEALPPASESEADETSITVTATGTRTTVEGTGQSVTVIGSDEIERVQSADITRVLERAPGVTFSRNGGVGSFTGVRLRGSEAEQVLTVLDGVRVADPAAPSGGFDYGTLLALDLDKVEVLRNSNSTIWGSDAIGGVIVASTRAEGGVAARAEYGSFDTVDSAISAGFSDEDVGFLGASASYFNTDGFSAAEGGTERDGFEQWTVNGHGRYYFSDRFEVFARARYAESMLDIDGFPPPSFALADTDEVQDTTQLFASAGAVYDSGPLFLSAAYSRAETDRDNLSGDGSETFTSQGTSDRIDLRGEWRPFGPFLLNFGGETEWTRYETLFDAGNDTRISGAYLQGGLEWRGIAAHFGARVDDHADFGTEVSFGGDASYAFAPDRRVRFSVGEGFKAPTLFQLYSDFGNLALQPEKSLGADIGVVYGDRALTSGNVYAAVTAYRRQTRDQLVFVGCFLSADPICVDRPFGTYDNVARSAAQGIEVEARVGLGNALVLGGAYALTDATNRVTGLDLPRRPRHAATLTADLVPFDRLTLGADLRIVSSSFDDAGNAVRLDGYETLALRAAFGLTDLIELFGRVENVWDEQYQTAAGYATSGRAAYVGARLKL